MLRTARHASSSSSCSTRTPIARASPRGASLLPRRIGESVCLPVRSVSSSRGAVAAAPSRFQQRQNPPISNYSQAERLSSLNLSSTIHPRRNSGFDATRLGNPVLYRSFSNASSNSKHDYNLSASSSTASDTPVLRTFNPNGHIDTTSAARYFYLPPDEWNMKELLPLVKNKQYCILYGPSQCGKTTRVLAFIEQLKKLGYLPFYVTLQRTADERSPMWEMIGNQIDPGHVITAYDFVTRMETLTRSGKKVVLFFDEADALGDVSEQDKDSFLNIMRSLKGTGVHAAFFIGRYMATQLNTSRNAFSPFNVACHIRAPPFDLNDVKKLFGEFEEEQHKKNPEFSLCNEIIEDIYKITEGRQGLVNLCGRRLAELVEKCEGKAPAFLLWQREWPIPRYEDYLVTANGKRILGALSEESSLGDRCRVIAYDLLYIPEINVAQDEEAVEALLQDGVVKFANSEGSTVQWLCPIICDLAEHALSLYRKALEPPPFPPTGKFDMSAVVAAILPHLNREILGLQKKSKNQTSPMQSQTTLQNAFVFEFSTLLHTMYSKIYNYRVDILPSIDVGRRKYTSLVLRGYNDRIAVVLELGINMNLTAEEAKPNDRATLAHHVKQAEKYHEMLKPEQTWVIHLTTVAPSHFDGGVYPFGPESNAVNVMHVYLHERLDAADIHLKGKKKIGPIKLMPLRSHKAFDLESFLRDEAKINPENVSKYLPLLKKNKVDETVLPLLSDTDLLACGITLPLDRAKIIEAAKQRTSRKRP